MSRDRLNRQQAACVRPSRGEARRRQAALQAAARMVVALWKLRQPIQTPAPGN